MENTVTLKETFKDDSGAIGVFDSVEEMLGEKVETYRNGDMKVYFNKDGIVKLVYWKHIYGWLGTPTFSHEESGDIECIGMNIEDVKKSIKENRIFTR